MSNPIRPNSTPLVKNGEAIATMKSCVESLLTCARDFKEEILLNLPIEQQEISQIAFRRLVESPLNELEKILRDPTFSVTDAHLHEGSFHKGICAYFGQYCGPFDSSRQSELKAMKKVYKEWYEKFTPAKLKLARTLHVMAPAHAKPLLALVQ